MVEIELDLASHLWEMLVTLRKPLSQGIQLNQPALQELLVLELASISDGKPEITPKGRKLVVRGSPRLWDLAA
jgi:hypothetical protein